MYIFTRLVPAYTLGIGPRAYSDARTCTGERETVTLLQWQRPKEINTDADVVVEIADTNEGVLLRAGSGDTALLVDRWAWADFLNAADAGEYSSTLPSADETMNQVWTDGEKDPQQPAQDEDSRGAPAQETPPNPPANRYPPHHAHEVPLFPVAGADDAEHRDADDTASSDGVHHEANG